MPTMQVMHFNDFTAAPALIPGVAPIPQPGSGQLLSRVHAAGVPPTELLPGEVVVSLGKWLAA